MKARYMIIDLTHPRWPEMRTEFRRMQRRGKLSIMHNRAGTEAIVKVLSASAAWQRNFLTTARKLAIRGPVMDTAGHRAFKAGEFGNGQWKDLAPDG